jgi:hypothetical protein
MITPFKNSSNAGKQREDMIRKLIIKTLIRNNRPLTRRQLSRETHLEISTLCQPLYDLLYKLGSIKIAYYGRCATTKKRVMHFAIKDIENLVNDGN